MSNNSRKNAQAAKATQAEKKKNANTTTGETKAPKVVVEGTEDTSGPVITGDTNNSDAAIIEGSSEVVTNPEEALIPDTKLELTDTEELNSDSEVVVERDYTKPAVIAVLGMNNETLAARIAARLSNYCTVVTTGSTMEALRPATNNLADVLSILNKSTQADFIDGLRGITKFIATDLEAHGPRSAFHGLTPYRPFRGACPPACSFLGTVLQLVTKETRKATISRYDPNSFNKFLDKDKKELFTAFFKE